MSGIEIIPFGRTEAEQAKLDRRKARGQAGLKGCALQSIALSLFVLFVCLFKGP
jgi:hypothetical protein